MIVNCQEHRKTMELIGLKLRLKEGIADPEERNGLEKRIKILERDLKLD